MQRVRKESGWKGLFDHYGWKLVVGFVLFYLIRDTILYLLIPYLVYQGACSGS
jgi:hypothetical protein